MTTGNNCLMRHSDGRHGVFARLPGHADVNITYNVYVHLHGDGFDEMYEALVEK